MRIFIFIITIFLFFSFSFAENLKDKIKENYEVINIPSNKIKSHKPQFSNKGKEYFFVGGMEYYPIESEEDLDYFEEKGYIKEKSLFLFKNGKISLIKNNFVNGKSVDCDLIGKTVERFIYSYIDNGVLKISKDKLIGKNKNSCFKYDDKFFFPKDSISKQDINYFKNNQNKLKDNLDYIKDNIQNKYKLEKIKYLYKYIMRNTNYNYEALKKGFSSDNIEAWSLSYFFNGGKVVCDGYVKALVFLSNYFNINSKRIIGDSQPIDNQKKVLEGFGHSWVKIGNNYFDPTFDDSEKNFSLDYFNKSKRCFNLNHYTTGWIKFSTTDERYSYIENNFSYLVNNCLGILNNVVLNDKKIESFIIDLFEKENVSNIKRYLCEYLSICDLSSSTKEGIKKDLSKYKIIIGNTEYKFDNILDNIYKDSVSDSEKEASSYETLISNDKKNKAKIISNKLFSVLKNYDYKERLRKFNYIKKTVDNYIKSGNISSSKKHILEYFQSIFVIEKIR